MNYASKRTATLTNTLCLRHSAVAANAKKIVSVFDAIRCNVVQSAASIATTVAKQTGVAVFVCPLLRSVQTIQQGRVEGSEAIMLRSH